MAAPSHCARLRIERMLEGPCKLGGFALSPVVQEQDARLFPGHVLVDGDNVEIFPGIRAYTGARHTYASQYLRVEGNPTFVLASDNCYLYRNLSEHKASATFSEADQPANIKNQARIAELASSVERIVPGHDILQFQKFATEGRITKIK